MEVIGCIKTALNFNITRVGGKRIPASTGMFALKLKTARTLFMFFSSSAQCYPLAVEIVVLPLVDISQIPLMDIRSHSGMMVNNKEKPSYQY